jgi:DnaJ family protein C protein 9
MQDDAAAAADSPTDDEEEEEESKQQQSSHSSVPARFAGQSVYEVLGVARGASTDEIKKGYRKMALRVHPDVNRSAEATVEFQYLSRCHELLADPRRRARYDATGVMDDGSGAGMGDDDLAAAAASDDAYVYWRTLFPKITPEDIEAYRVTYEGGEEEKEDLANAWAQHKPNVRLVFEAVPFASAASVPRLCARLNDELGARISKAAITTLQRQLAKDEQAEAGEAEEAMQQLSAQEQLLLRGGGGGGAAAGSAAGGGGGEGALALIMQNRARQRQQAGSSFLEALEARARAAEGGGKKKAAGKPKAAAAAAAASGSKANGKRKTAPVAMDDEEDAEEEEEEQGAEPTEDEFAAIQRRQEERRAAAKAAKAIANGNPSPAKKGRKK